MAKRKRHRRLGHLTTDLALALQDRLEGIAGDENQFRLKGQTAAARRQRDKLDGALEAAEAVGAYCQCFSVTKKIDRCSCGTTASAMASRTQSVRSLYKTKGLRKPLALQKQSASFRGTYFDGVRCRDGSGAFVPVSQCKGPVGRDAGGRFVSLK